MTLRRHCVPLLIVLLSSSILPVVALPTFANSASVDALPLERRDAPGDPAALLPLKTNPVGTEHAPVDGKDGMPHEGPFVETDIDRNRKKSKDLDMTDSSTLSKSSKDPYGSRDMPLSNDGVMDDPGRTGPAEGMRGTEGGVSEKSKDTATGDKIPDPPKEARPLPQSEVEKLWQAKDTDATLSASTEEKKQQLEKPADLPGKPHSIPPPESPSYPKDNSQLYDQSTAAFQAKDAESEEHQPAVIQPLHSLLLSFTMILVSEVGDKTFLVAALMAMRHDRLVVFTAAFSALISMTVLSAVLGHAVPTLIPRSVTNFLAAALFLIFGIKMLFEARKMSPDEGVSEEMREVEMELEEKEHQQRRMSRRRSSISPYVLEAGRGVRKVKVDKGRLPSPPDSPLSASSRDVSPSRHSVWSNLLAGANNLCSLLLSPAWVQTFVMTFLGEWGDRSQIATIAMAAGQDYWWVTAGALAGHGLCTGAAVLGGKAIAGRVSMRTVTMGGAIAFLVFGIIYLFEAIY